MKLKQIGAIPKAKKIMRNPLNDPHAFAALCAGASGAFGFAACLTLGTEHSASFAELSVIILIISAAMYITQRLAERLHGEEDTKEPALSANKAGHKGSDRDIACQDHAFIITKIHGVVKDGDTDDRA